MYDASNVSQSLIFLCLLLLTHTHTQCVGIDDLEDHEIALPPSYTAPSSPRKHPTSLSFRSAPPLLLPDSPSMEGGAFFSKGEVVTEAALKVVTGQIKRRVDSSYRIERLAFCLNVHTIDLANIR